MKYLTENNNEFTPEQFIKTFSHTLFNLLRQINSGNYYMPQYANTVMKDINISPIKPIVQDIEKWLLYPHLYEQQLSNLSQYLESIVMQYERTIYHFATILDFNYYIYPISPVPDPKIDKKKFNTYKNSKKKAIEWLRKFRPREQLFNVTLGVIREGGKFYYIRESDEFIDLQELPPNYCVIDGRTSLGYTFAFDMKFFLKFPRLLSAYAPEFIEWFNDFYEDYKDNKIISYKRMPPEKSVVFLFDDTRSARLNPLRALFKDVLDTQEYKSLLKTKAMLDTFKLIYLKVPLDKDGKPTLDRNLIANWVAVAQACLPPGAVAFGSPMEAEELKVSDNQSVNFLDTLSGKKFWENAGISPLTYGSPDARSVAAIKSSNITDVSFIDHMYRQYIKFINFQLYNKTGGFKFGINMFGDTFSRQETTDKYRNSATLGICKKEYLASLGKEPFEYEMQMDDVTMYQWDTQAFIPLSTSYTMSPANSLGGRPPKPEDELGDAGDITRSAGSNIDKVVS